VFSVTEEVRLFRANDRPFNLSYHYAVSTEGENVGRDQRPPAFADLSPRRFPLPAGQRHQDRQIQPRHLPAAQPLRAVPEARQRLLPLPHGPPGR